MPRIVAVGACYIDTILTVPHYPGEDDKLRASKIAHRRGGNCPNTLEVLRDLARCHPNAFPNMEQLELRLLAVLPAEGSPATEFIRESLCERLLYPLCIFREQVQEAASSYIIKSQGTGSRTIVNYNGLPEMTVDEFIQKSRQIRTLANAVSTWYHFEGRIPEVTIRCIQFLRSDFPQYKISVEVEKPGREGLTALAAAADLIFYSRSWAENQGYHSGKECLEAQLSKTRDDAMLCCTWGAGGASAVLKSPHSTQAWASVFSTIGAGDTFIAGMLYALTINDFMSFQQKLEFANELAGRKVVQEGFAGLADQLHLT
ncbi:pfkB family kinase [Clohesyomyces aquaticus]|uniref:PfkB family kinase n=1 Tax=Clohesyomyces aquaticus TaxID=1231657 RepID=A0A1Y1YZJ7_9PLEO|nr:pfkB family kinase [Clohesyomyces aquaticus]